MNIWKVTKKYEVWLGRFINLLKADLRLKHQNMASDVFVFLRATYYWWALIWRRVCPDLANAPVVLAVGDLHVENFGSWFDRLRRWIWGINDVDEAYPLPYTNDLLRLGTSAILALDSNRLKQLTPEAACQTILDGYRAGMESGGKPFVLAEHPQLKRLLNKNKRNPQAFWTKMQDLAREGKLRGKDVPARVLAALESLLPNRKLKLRIFHRPVGEGSLGRKRFTGLTMTNGSPFAVEAKALAPSASVFARGGKSQQSYYMQILRQAVRCQDPYVQVVRRQILRKVGPEYLRIELNTLTQLKDERLLLWCMGFETANFHLGTSGAQAAVLADLNERPATWLVDNAKKMANKMHKGRSKFAKRLARTKVPPVPNTVQLQAD